MMAAYRRGRGELGVGLSRVVVALSVVAVLSGAVAAWAVERSDDAAPAAGAASSPSSEEPPAASPAPTTTVVPGMAPVLDATNVYSALSGGAVQPSLAALPHRVYVPNGLSDTVSVIDPVTFTVMTSFRTGDEPQHVVPSFDLTTLWVLDNGGNTLIPIDPATSIPGPPVEVDDPYNLYFTPDGALAIVVAEARERLDLRDPHTMALVGSIDARGCDGINHIDYSADGAYLIATCEFSGRLAKVDWRQRQVVGFLDLPAPGGSLAMPQDIRLSPDGTTFFVADMATGGVHIVDAATFTVTGFIPTSTGAHGITPARDGRHFYVANRGFHTLDATAHGPGSVSVVDTVTRQVTATWPIPDGGSPDMGNLDTTGTQLWLSGRYDDEVYVIDVASGGLVARIPVGVGPHGLCYWPQPGRYSLGHTGNMR